MARCTYLLIAAAVLIGIGLSSRKGLPIRAEGAAMPVSTVRIGLISSMFRDTPEPMIQLMIRPFKTLLESQTGVTGQIVASGNSDTLGRQIKDDQVQLGVFHGVEFAWARIKNPELKPLLIAVNEQRFLRAVLVIRKDSPATVMADLYGKSLALPRLSREHCHLFLERRCAKPGSKPEECFREITSPGDVEDALDEVVDQQVACAVVDSVAFACYTKLKPGRSAKLRTLQESEPFPCAVVAYLPGVLSESLLDRFREGMIAAKTNTRGKHLLEMCRITSFEAIPADYERMLNDIVKAYPPPASK